MKVENVQCRDPQHRNAHRRIEHLSRRVVAINNIISSAGVDGDVSFFESKGPGTGWERIARIDKAHSGMANCTAVAMQDENSMTFVSGGMDGRLCLHMLQRNGAEPGEVTLMGRHKIWPGPGIYRVKRVCSRESLWAACSIKNGAIAPFRLQDLGKGPDDKVVLDLVQTRGERQVEGDGILDLMVDTDGKGVAVSRLGEVLAFDLNKGNDGSRVVCKARAAGTDGRAPAAMCVTKIGDDGMCAVGYEDGSISTIDLKDSHAHPTLVASKLSAVTDMTMSKYTGQQMLVFGGESGKLGMLDLRKRSSIFFARPEESVLPHGKDFTDWAGYASGTLYPLHSPIRCITEAIGFTGAQPAIVTSSFAELFYDSSCYPNPEHAQWHKNAGASDSSIHIWRPE